MSAGVNIFFLKISLNEQTLPASAQELLVPRRDKTVANKRLEIDLRPRLLRSLVPSVRCSRCPQL
jgi:hypothetical protein